MRGGNANVGRTKVRNSCTGWTKLFATSVALVLAPALARADDFETLREHNWHHWRGPNANGVAPHADPPLQWGPSENVKWKVAIDGEGSATPIIWQGRVFVLTAIPTDRVAEAPPQADDRAKTRSPGVFYQYTVLCLDRENGKERWRKVACEAVPHEGRHRTNTYASGSPTTDGERLYVSFGSQGLFCFDLHGNRLWEKDLGTMRTRYGWGEAVTPVVSHSRLVVNCDQEDQSFITVLDARTGDAVWRKDRDEPTTWATPLIVEHDGRRQLIVNGTNRVRSYDLESGEVIWECGGQSVNAIPSPVLSGNLVYCMTGYRTSFAAAIPLTVKGDVTGRGKLVWTHTRGTPYVPSPIVYGENVYFTASNREVLTCLNKHTGEPVFEPRRLDGLRGVYASPVAAAGRLYFTGRNGTTVVLEGGDTFKVLATNRLDEPVDASPALVGNQMFLRSSENLYCVE